MDKLSISGFKVSTLIGSLDWEQHVKQNLYCDVIIQTNAAHIALSDKIDEAIDYDRLTKSLKTFVENNHFQLIETLADKLATHLLEHFNTPWIQITVHKPGALKEAKDISITLERTK